MSSLIFDRLGNSRNFKEKSAKFTTFANQAKEAAPINYLPITRKMGLEIEIAIMAAIMVALHLIKACRHREGQQDIEKGNRT